MVSTEYSQAMVEILEIIEHSEDNIKNKIPKGLIEFWQANKSENYKPNLDHNKSLYEMNLKPKTKALITMIYSKYLCNETEKKNLQLKLKSNEKELSEKYNKNIFEKQDKKETVNSVEFKENNNVAMVKYKEPIIKRIINNIKKRISCRK